MIITLKDTTTQQVATTLLAQREAAGSGALGRVLTLIVVVDDMIDVERAIEISDAASREHPCRVIVVVDAPQNGSSATLNAQVRVGDSAGPSEVVVLEPRGEAAHDLDLLVMPLLLPDTPVVAFWPTNTPENPGAHPLGRLAIRRITDSRATATPVATLHRLAQVYTPGDTDLAWSGITLWRALLAGIVSAFPAPVSSVTVRGNATHPSSYLIAVWLNRMLNVPTEHQIDADAETITDVAFELADGTTASLSRSARGKVAHLSRTGLATMDVNLARRSVQDCLMEELRRLDPDVFYGKILTENLSHYQPVAHQVTLVKESQ
ncbi:glucose-6-phosphate dehydrogenase assembly protein OpcA [Schaalia suimastitidis]|uniref:glucose-6-phosphate dehydrogenase assembly protein OpcA n=1 Tax=Schaalia suimastitidis TaxID=121163 RepID=UPI0003F84226|nr:glucose-6-phosphate dehydrogenase assembly protein OpcA [Schaalia suimastitidis]